MYSRYGDCPPDSRVSSFGDLRFNGYVLLGAAFRSLSRPSSAPSAKAFTKCSLSLDLDLSIAPGLAYPGLMVFSGDPLLLITSVNHFSGFSVAYLSIC